MSKYGSWTRGEDEALLNILGGEEVARDILRSRVKVVIQKIISTITHTFTVSVDETQSVEDLVKVGNFNWSNDSITSKNFPKQKKGQKTEKEIVLFHFDKAMSSDSVIAEMSTAGYRPASVWELISLAIKEPDLQRSFPIVALGSVCGLGGRRRVVCLCAYDGARELRLDYFDDDWNGRYRFAGVRKS